MVTEGTMFLLRINVEVCPVTKEEDEEELTSIIILVTLSQLSSIKFAIMILVGPLQTYSELQYMAYL